MDPNLLIVKRTRLVFPELSYKLAGLFFNVHNNLGRFCKEKIYGDALSKLLDDSNFKFEREKRLDINIKDINLTKNWADFVVENKILLELKAKRFITRSDYIQTLRYLEFFNLPLGIIVNFQQRFLKPKRILNPKYSS